MPNLASAVAYAKHVHRNDRRKWGGQLYIYHPMRVMTEAMLRGMNEAHLMAAVCHDILEDHPEPTPEAAYKMLNWHIGSIATSIVGMLTNRFTKEAYPDMNRADRKAAEFKRLGTLPDSVKILKMYDRIDNLESIGLDIGFSRLYGEESLLLFDHIGHADPELDAKGRRLAIEAARAS